VGTPEDAIAAQIRTIETRTGRSMDEWVKLVHDSGKAGHGQIIDWLKAEHGFTHGNANRVALLARQATSPSPSGSDLVDAQYAGTKTPLRPIYDLLVAAARELGDDVDVSPKKTGVSLRRTKQFALVQAPSAKRVVLGLNHGSPLPAAGRLRAVTGMCTHEVVLTSIADVDDDVRRWLRAAYDQA
jgi:hypothetical protein